MSIPHTLQAVWSPNRWCVARFLILRNLRYGVNDTDFVALAAVDLHDVLHGNRAPKYFLRNLDGVRIEAETEKEAKKAVSKALRQAKKEQEKRNIEYGMAKMKAESSAYRLLAWKAEGHEFPRGLTFYTPTDEWSKHLFQPCETNYHGFVNKHKLNAADAHGIEYDHYGYELLGAVCNGSGYCAYVFVHDRDNNAFANCCLAIGVEGNTLAWAECPGVTIDDFRKPKDRED